MKSNKVQSEYFRLRKLGFQAKWALSSAKSNIRFDELESDGLVEFKLEPDECADWDNLVGDCYNPQVNTDIQESKLKEQERAEMDRANQDGVWGIVSLVNNEQIDSVWGFIGDDWKDSGYDSDVKQSAIDFLAEQFVKEQPNFTTCVM